MFAVLSETDPSGSGRRVIGRGMLKREQSLDSICWDQLHRGVSIDDFRKLSALQQTASPLGSREHLATTGIIWNGTLTGTIDRNIMSRPIRMSSKPVGPKQKMLRKQQSMLAFFPEYSTLPPQLRSPLPLVTQPAVATSSGVGGDTLPQSVTKISRPSLVKGLPSRSQSLEDTQTNDDQENATSSTMDQPLKVDKVSNSVVCIVS